MDDKDKLTPEQAVRLLRAKVGELENAVLHHTRIDSIWLAADIALVADILADHMERTGWAANVEVEDA